MTVGITKSHSPSCRHRVPIKTPYQGGSDRVLQTFVYAIALANKRAMTRGRQSVRQHSGPFTTRVWVVQDIEDAP